MPARVTRIFYDADANLGTLKGKTVAILGYGSQGTRTRSTARLGHRRGRRSAPGLGEPRRGGGRSLEVLDVAEAASRGDVVMVLLPDERQAEAWEAEIRDGIARPTC